MKKIYFVQVNAIYGEVKKSIYVPYATGCIAAYAFDDEIIKSNYENSGFVYARIKLNDALDMIKEPDIVAFSCSTWNTEYNKKLAEKVKDLYPECIIIFGGHNVPDGTGMLEENNYIDYLIHGEGEIPFKNLLYYFIERKSISDIFNISYRKGSDVFSTGKKDCDFIDFPSPYTNGTFDEILNDDYDFSVIFETNRGCPNRCAFCDWGKLHSKVRMFSQEKISAELEWFSRNHIEYIYCADANFGLFDRDIELIKEILQLKEKTGYPQKFKVNFSKNHQDTVIKVSSLMSKSNLGKAQTLSFQSLNPQVLKNIGRKNLDIKYFNNLISYYNSEGIRTYSELILGLPGETKESFIDGIDVLLKSGQHKTVNVYPCELLPNSLLGSMEYIKKYNLKCTSIPFLQYHCKENDDISGVTEFSETISSTASMSIEDTVESFFFATVVQTMHMLGLTRFIAVYLYNEKNITYKDFYLSLIKYAESTGGFINKALMKTYNRIKKVYSGELPFAECDLHFGNITFEADEILYMRCLYNYDDFTEELKCFVSSLVEESEEINALENFQSSVIRHPEHQTTEIVSEYDFYSYFNSFFVGKPEPLKKEHARIKINNVDLLSWKDYGKYVLWYGRHNEKTVLLSESYLNKSEE